MAKKSEAEAHQLLVEFLRRVGASVTSVSAPRLSQHTADEKVIAVYDAIFKALTED